MVGIEGRHLPWQSGRRPILHSPALLPAALGVSGPDGAPHKPLPELDPLPGLPAGGGTRGCMTSVASRRMPLPLMEC